MSRAVVLPANKITLLISASLVAGFLLGRWTNANNRPPDALANQGKGAFVLLVNFKFATLSHRDTFLRLIEPVCQDVLVKEGPTASNSNNKSTKSTLSYQVAISDKDPLMVMLIERYTDKENGYLKVHKSGTAFLKFREQLKGMQERGEVAIEGESYVETNLGFV